jgi:hypothetical protein
LTWDTLHRKLKCHRFVVRSVKKREPFKRSLFLDHRLPWATGRQQFPRREAQGYVYVQPIPDDRSRYLVRRPAPNCERGPWRPEIRGASKGGSTVIYRPFITDKAIGP